MEIYDQLGLAGTVLANANSRCGPNLAKLQDGHTHFPGVQIFEQSCNGDMLAGALTAGGGDIRWRNRLVGLQDRTATPDGQVEVLLEGRDGTSCGCGPGSIGADVPGRRRPCRRWCVRRRRRNQTG